MLPQELWLNFLPYPHLNTDPMYENKISAKRFLVTGGAGFIGSALIRLLISQTNHEVCVFDKLTYAGNLASLEPIETSQNYRFIHGDICNPASVREAFCDFKPEIVIHLAAETHVDRSIDGPSEFIGTNIGGTFVMMQEALRYYKKFPGLRDSFRFHHVSTDEVFGALGKEGSFSENSPYRPTSPYSASKAASDHLVRAWHHTYGLPTIVSNCSNNYGPYQFPEKLIPTIIINCLEEKPVPIYGQGRNVRDWLHVDDHARALIVIALTGKVGESYNVGSDCQRTNIDVARTICRIIDRIENREDKGGSERLIAFVADRPGHDHRYAVDASKIASDLDWRPAINFERGLEDTVRWYIDNRKWWHRIRSGDFKGERLGLVERVTS